MVQGTRNAGHPASPPAADSARVTPVTALTTQPTNPTNLPRARVPRRSSRAEWALGAVLLGLLLPGCDRPPPRSPEAGVPEIRPDAHAEPTTRGSLSLVHPAGRLSPEQARDLAALEAREQAVATTTWAPELLAQRAGQTFEAFWDALHRAPLTNRLELAATLPASVIVTPRWRDPEVLPHGIRQHLPDRAPGSGTTLDREGWRALVRNAASAGWQLRQVEVRHLKFDPPHDDQPGRSELLFTAHLVKPSEPARATLEGSLRVEWETPPAGETPIPARHIDASDLRLATRSGPVPFRTILEDPIESPRDTSLIDPLLVYDLDGDDFPEILLAGRNLLYRRQPDGSYRSETLCRRRSGPLVAAVVGDFNGDAIPDLLAMQWEALVLFRGSAGGLFQEPARPAWPADGEVRYVMGLTAGDIDADGDLDVLLVQYKVPYENGSMPTPFHDALDGYPARLLINDGHGRFTDATGGSGLMPKSRRRSYGASWVDLDGDSRLDLVVISDFAGIDVYRGDGRGRFVDLTDRWIPERRAFGMAHAFSDFNRDGRLDVLMMGMTSATASRLDHLRLQRPDATDDPSMRARMTHGSRLYLAREPEGFVEDPLSQTIAASGWSWGCSAWDVDNDSFPDVYVANGLESRETVRDYEGEYWLHDLYVGRSEEQPTPYLYFMTKFNRTRGRGQSYGGYDKNRFYWNRQGAGFLEVGHLFGLAWEADSRNVVATDLDLDGRPDLLITSYETWPNSRQVLRVFGNSLAATDNWIGFHLRSTVGAPPPAGARVEMVADDHSAVRTIVNGDSYRSQHPTTVHFGLGQAKGVVEARIRWPGGRQVVLSQPTLNRYHPVVMPVATPRE